VIPHIARVSLLTALTGSRTGLAVIEVASLCAAAHGAHEHASRGHKPTTPMVRRHCAVLLL